jgi:hypothetical protein
MFNNPPGVQNLGAFFALRAKNRAFRSKSADLLMQILWAFRCNPWRGLNLARNPGYDYTAP